MGEGKQLLFVVETNKIGQIDVGYINEIIRYFYQIDRDIVIHYVYMEGKFKYQHKKVLNDIRKYQNMYQGNTIVLYVFDKDEASVDIRDSEFILSVQAYCEERKYELIWFVKNIKHVLHHKIIPQKDKKKMLDQFKRKRMIASIEEQSLRNPNPCKSKTSNILYVLDRYLMR